MVLLVPWMVLVGHAAAAALGRIGGTPSGEAATGSRCTVVGTYGGNCSSEHEAAAPSLLQRASLREQLLTGWEGPAEWESQERPSLRQKEHRGKQLLGRRVAAGAGGAMSEAEKAAFLMKASFGPSRGSLDSMGSMTQEKWIHAQMSLEPTLHRAFYRARVNPRAGKSNVSALPREVCEVGSRWLNFAFSRRDEGLPISVVNGVVSVGDAFRTDLDAPGFGKSGLDAASAQGWAGLSFQGEICEVEEVVGGDVKVKTPTCNSGSSSTLPNLALWIVAPAGLSTEVSLSFSPGPKVGVVILADEAAAAVECTLDDTPFIKHDGKFYMHDPRLQLLDNVVGAPASGNFGDAYLMVDGSKARVCRPEGQDVNGASSCEAVAGKLGLSYQKSVSWISSPRYCITDGSSVWYNRHNTGASDAAYRLICKRPCPVVAKTFQNEAGCRIAEACGATRPMACGSPGEVGSDPAKGNRYGFYFQDDHDRMSQDKKRDPEYKSDWGNGLDKQVVWTVLALKGEDQLRQRMAWALSQIFVTSVRGFGGYDKHNEMWLNYYDIFVRHAFGSFRDVVKEVTYNPIMAQYLTYWKSRSFDSDGKYPDENYARELMQLFTLGQWKLNMNGTTQKTPTGDLVLTYDNDDILSISKVFTGFDQQADRGNIERMETGRNFIDPMRIVPAWHDVYPKPDLNDNYLGDLYPLCRDLTTKAFLQAGATYEFLGYDYGGEGAFEVEAGSALHDALVPVAVRKQLASTVPCSGEECDLDAVKVVKVGNAYYEHVPPTCVHLFFFNAQLVEQSSSRFGQPRYSKCANPYLREASTACCTPDERFIPKAFANGEYVPFGVANSRCMSRNMQLCSNSGPSAAATGDDDGIIDVWTSRTCGMSVAVDTFGNVASQANPTTRLNWFAASWENGNHPVPGSCPAECQGVRVPASSGTVLAPFVVSGDYVELPESAGALGGINFTMDCTSPSVVAFEAFVLAPDGTSDSFKIEVDGKKVDWHTNSKNAWAWSAMSPGFDVSPGRHAVLLLGREDGIKIESLQLVRGGEACRLAAPSVPLADSCVCSVEVVETAVFGSIPSPEELHERLFIGALPPTSSQNVQEVGGVTAYFDRELLCSSTVFEHEGRYFKNMESVVRLGSSYAFRNPPTFMDATEPTERAAHAEVDALIDHLVDHPNTPVHVAYRLIQRFTTSNPSPDYIEAVAEAFASGSYAGTVYSGKRGDLKAAVLATLLHGAQEANPSSMVQEGSSRGGSTAQSSKEAQRTALRQLSSEGAAGARRACAGSLRNPLETSRNYSSVRSGSAIGTGNARSMLHSVQAWTPSSNSGSWMEIDLGGDEEVSGVVVQGRQGSTLHWTKTFKVNTSLDGVTWTQAPGTFDGSQDQDSLVEALLPAPQAARYVRILPQSWYGRVALRAGVLVCAEATCNDWDVRLANTDVQGSRGTPEVYFQGQFHPICGYKWYWGSTETRQFCRNLGGTGGVYERVAWIYDEDAVEARDWQRFYQEGLTGRCSAGNAISMEIECYNLTTQSSCPSPAPAAPTPAPAGVLQLEVWTAGCDFPGCGMSSFYLNGQDLEGPSSRGFNMVTMSTQGEVLSRSTWDVASRDDVRAFLDVLHRMDFGTMILIGVKDRAQIIPNVRNDWTQYIKTIMEEALTELGATEFRNLSGQMPYALIAKKGFPNVTSEVIGIKDDTRLLKLEASFPEEIPPTAPAPPTASRDCANFDVRLTDVLGTRGYPEVFISGNWRPLCRHGFTSNSANLFCQALGAPSGTLRSVEGMYEEDAVEIRTWGGVHNEGLTGQCQAGKPVSAWIQCDGPLATHSTCAEAAPQSCSFQPIASAACPCEHGNHGTCNLKECNWGISPGELCEADQPLPDGRQDWEVNNCAEHYDVFEYVCGGATPTPAPTPFPQGGLHFQVESACYNAGFGGWSTFSLNGVDLGGPTSRGINVMLLDNVGQVLNSSNFDLGNFDKPSDLAETNRFAEAMADIPNGTIVLLSVSHNAYTWNEEAPVRDALAALGSEKPWPYYRTPYVLMVKKGSTDQGVYEGLGSYRDYNVLSVEGWFSTTDAPTAAPTQAPPPTASPTAAPTPPLTAEELEAYKAAQVFGKLREPVVKMMHFLRAMEYKEADEDRDPLFDTLENRIGQWMYKSPSVFNFYKPEYSPVGFNGSFVAPEFEIFTPPYAINFYNAMMVMIDTGLNSCNGGFGETQFSCSEDHGRFTYAKHGGAPEEEVLKELDLLLTAGRLGSSPDMEVVRTAYANADEGDKLKAAQRALLFTPEFNTLGESLAEGQRPPEVEEVANQQAVRPYKALVKLFFKGGMDSFNMLVPLECERWQEYLEVRSDIALDGNSLHQISTDPPQAGCSKFGIHANLPILHSLYNAGEAAFVSNIGGLVEPLTKEQYRRGEGKRCLGLFSHSDQILGAQTLECQSGNGASRGAGGRLGDGLADQAEKYRTSSFSVSGAEPWSQGFDTHTEILDQNTGTVRLRNYDAMKTVIGNITQIRHGQIYSEEYVTQLGTAVEDAEELAAYLSTVTLESPKWDLSFSLARQLSQVAKLIKSKDVRLAERDVAFTAIGGFDHHNEVINALAGRFVEINSAITAFVDELKLMGDFDKVTLVTASDFGRTLTSNGAGSDHGWGGNHFIIGGDINGGKIYGQFPESLSQGNDRDAGRGRLIPTTPWEGLEMPCAEWMGLDASQYGYVYPNSGNFNASEHFISSATLFK